MALTKVTKGGITDNAVDSDKLKDGSITTAKIGASAIESSEINNGTVTVDDLASSLNLSPKTVTLPNTSVTAGMLAGTLDLSPKTVTLPGATLSAVKQPIQDNIALLGFKMAVNDGLTVFNLVDGIVDEFHDESGTDEGESSNDTYCGTNDFYNNSNATNATSIPLSVPYSAGFAIRTVTEADTSEAATNFAMGVGTPGTFTVPTGLTSVAVKMWGAGGGGGYYGNVGAGFTQGGSGGGGGYVAGTIAVTPGQVLKVGVAEGGTRPSQPTYNGGLHADHPQRQPQAVGTRKNNSAGAGYIANGPGGFSGPQAPSVFLVVGGGGTAGDNTPDCQNGGAGGGTTGCAGGAAGAEQTNYVQEESARHGGGGDQEQGGQGDDPSCSSQMGGLFYGGGKGGAGYYGGGSGGGTDPGCNSPQYAGGAGGGGSSYYGHPQITSGSTEEGAHKAGGGQSISGYVTNTNRGTDVNDPTNIVDAHPSAHPGPDPGGPTMGAGGFGSPNTQANYGQDGYVLMTGTSGPVAATVASTVIMSNAFAAGSVPTNARIVVFEENVGTPTLNTDIIASVSRNGGSNFTTATLADSGYVTGASGQRILTGQASISGQPSGQSMKWKLALANNIVKIHGVALQWS